MRRESATNGIKGQVTPASFDPQLPALFDLSIQLTFALESMIAHQRLAGNYPAGSALQEIHCQKSAEYRLQAQELERQVKQGKI